MGWKNLECDLESSNCSTWIHDIHTYNYLDLQGYVCETLDHLVLLDLQSYIIEVGELVCVWSKREVRRYARL